MLKCIEKCRNASHHHNGKSDAKDRNRGVIDYYCLHKSCYWFHGHAYFSLPSFPFFCVKAIAFLPSLFSFSFHKLDSYIHSSSAFVSCIVIVTCSGSVAVFEEAFLQWYLQTKNHSRSFSSKDWRRDRLMCLKYIQVNYCRVLQTITLVSSLKNSGHEKLITGNAENQPVVSNKLVGYIKVMQPEVSKIALSPNPGETHDDVVSAFWCY